jgi:transcriptional regulator GlxA family with amidase domain
VRLAADSLPVSGDRIRRGGFRLLPQGAPISKLAAQYLSSFSDSVQDLPPAELDAAIAAFDLLVAASLGDTPALQRDEGRALNAARVVMARGYIERNVDNTSLAPEHVAAHLGVSARQVHRIFAREGTSVTLELRRLRVRRAQALLARQPLRAVTDIALSCGFDSLATFYRCFRTETGMTASEWRSQCAT